MSCLLQNSLIAIRELTSPDLHYHLENFEDIFRTGSQLWEQHEEGIRSFAVLSTGYQTSQQKAIMGLACYFDLKKRSQVQKIAIVTSHLKQGLFSEFIPHCVSEGAIHSFHHHFDFIDWGVLLKNSSQESFNEQALIEYLSPYAIILWDVPEFSLIERNAKAFEPFLRRMESLCILSAKGGKEGEEIEQIASYFQDYGLNFGCLRPNKDGGQKIGAIGRGFWGRLKNLSFFSN